MNKTGVVIAVVLIAVLTLIVYGSIGGRHYRVNVCMVYGGHTACKTVKSRTEKGALTTAITGACADIVSGVTDTMNCEQTEPQSTKWLERPK